MLDCSDIVWHTSTSMGFEFPHNRFKVIYLTFNFCFSSSTVATIVLYFIASMKNPGYIQGNTLYEVANIGAYNPNMDVLRKNDVIEMTDFNLFKNGGTNNKKGGH